MSSSLDETSSRPPSTGKWEVAPYSGRGELVGISGSGAVSGRLANQALSFDGSFDCDGSPVNPPTP